MAANVGEAQQHPEGEQAGAVASAGQRYSGGGFGHGRHGAAFPDLHAEVEEILECDDRIVSRLRFQGTHQGEFMGVPASGRRIDVPTIDIVRVVDGRATEHWGITDTMTMMQQIGAIPEGAPA